MKKDIFIHYRTNDNFTLRFQCLQLLQKNGDAAEPSKSPSFFMWLLFVIIGLDMICKIQIQTKDDENER